MASGSFKRVKGTLPKRSNLSGQSFQSQHRALSRIGDAHIREHRKTVSAWEHETPTFSKSITSNGAAMQLLVFTSGNLTGQLKYIWVDEGTPPHEIMPHNPSGVLVFNVPYYPSTEPGVIGSRTASRGSDTQIAQSVHHPGGAPRMFSETINENLDQHDRRLIQEAGIKI